MTLSLRGMRVLMRAAATAIFLQGTASDAAITTVVGVLVDVSVMLSVCAVCNRTRGWFDGEEALAVRVG